MLYFKARADSHQRWQYRDGQIDATRVSDGALVFIKAVKTDGDELSIALFFSEKDRRADPHNHCVPILDAFPDDQDPTYSYMIMPFLRHIDDPRMEFVADVIDYTGQILEVSQDC